MVPGPPCHAKLLPYIIHHRDPPSLTFAPASSKGSERFATTFPNLQNNSLSTNVAVALTCEISKHGSSKLIDLRKFLSFSLTRPAQPVMTVSESKDLRGLNLIARASTRKSACVAHDEAAEEGEEEEET